MIKSIQQFQTNGIAKLEKIFEEYASDPTKIAEMVHGVTDSVVNLGLSLIAEEWEWYDQVLRDRKDMRPGWQIIRRDRVSKLTSLGEVVYEKTYFKNVKTGERCYLLDRLLGMAPKERLTEDAVARLLDEAADSSYRKGGLNASIAGNSVSKETVMDKIHPLVFPEVAVPEEKRKAATIYIDADEDHVSLQYLEEKGDLKGTRGKTLMPKLIYVYEGIDTESDRHELINAKYFGGRYEGTDGNKLLWDEVYEYIAKTYDEESLERIYVSGDGAGWIRQGAKVHEKAKFVLDKYHVYHYIITATAHLMDSAQDARSEIWQAINGQRKRQVAEVFDRILNVTDSESKQSAVETARDYILDHWTAIMTGVKNKGDNIHCSAEGHISHIFADRMSSRPLGWSPEGADKMARLRIYKKNGGDMLDLVRYQKEPLPKAAGAEDVIYSSSQIQAMVNRNREKLGAMADVPICRIPYTQVKKIASIRYRLEDL